MSAQRQLPLRVALIGLSASAVTSWAAQAHIPYLLSEEGRKYFTITALCNSSIEAAQRTIGTYNLPNTIKAYGTPEDLAHDKDVDAIICCTRVDVHLKTIVPSIQAGKDVYVEWPVASNVEDTAKILADAERHNCRVVVGLQGRYSPPVQKIKDLLTNSDTGRVLSSEAHVWGGSTSERDTLFSGWEYFAERALGGNHYTILFGHFVDQMQHVLGNFAKNSSHAIFQVRFPNIRVIEGRDVVRTITADSPDLFSVIGKLEAADHSIPSASLQASYHREWPFPGEATISWTITCEKKTIRLRAFDYASLQADAYGKPVLIEVLDNTTQVVANIDWSWRDDSLPVRSRNTAISLKAFATGDKQNFASLSEALTLTEQLEQWLVKGAW